MYGGYAIQLQESFTYFCRRIYEFLFFHAEYEGQIISIAMILLVYDTVQYFLSGSNPRFNHLSPTSQLIYEVALFGQAHVYAKFHLGGGLPTLLKYKQGFNKYSDLTFEIGRKIFNQTVYDELVALRQTIDPDYSADSSFFPLYRA